MAEFTPSTVPGCRTPHPWLRNLPLTVIDIDSAEPYRHKLVLSRPDQHVAMRLIDIIRGASPA